MLYGARHYFILCLLSPSCLQSMNYRHQGWFPTLPEEDTTSSSSSSSGNNSQEILGVLSSPSSYYLIQSLLGEGTFGKVIKCVKIATKETVAVKMIKNNRFKSEANNEVEQRRCVLQISLQKASKALHAALTSNLTYNSYVVGEHPWTTAVVWLRQIQLYQI